MKKRIRKGKYKIIVVLLIVILIGILLFFLKVNKYIQANNECKSNPDCIPSSCCHPDSCVPLSKKPICKGILCTQECSSVLDCGNAGCSCVNNKCQVKK